MGAHATSQQLVAQRGGIIDDIMQDARWLHPAVTMPPRPGQKAATALQDVETRQQTGQVMLLEFIELAGSGGWGQLWDVVGQMHPAAPDQATSANPLQPTEVSMALKLLLSWAYLPSRVKSAYSGLPEYMQKQTEALGSEAACMLACQNEEVIQCVGMVACCALAEYISQQC